MIRVVIADDEALVRGGLRMILEAQGDIEVVGEADDGPAALELVRRDPPDVVLMDILIPRRIEAEAAVMPFTASTRATIAPSLSFVLKTGVRRIDVDPAVEVLRHAGRRPDHVQPILCGLRVPRPSGAVPVMPDA